MKNFLALFILLTCSLLGVDTDPANGEIWDQYFFSEFNASVRFPSEPSHSESFDSVSYTALDSSSFPITLYGITFVKNPLEDLDADKYFDNILEKRASTPSILVDYQISHDGEFDILDLIVGNRRNDVMQKERFIVKEGWITSFTTLFYPMSSEKHTYFVNSFCTY